MILFLKSIIASILFSIWLYMTAKMVTYAILRTKDQHKRNTLERFKKTLH